MTGPRRKPVLRLVLLAALVLVAGTAATLLSGGPRGPVLGGKHRIERRGLPPAPEARPGVVRPVTERAPDAAPAAVQNPADLTVRVLLHPAGTPVPGAAVDLYDAASVWSGVADATGEVRFEGFESGGITLLARAEGCLGTPRAWTTGAEGSDAVDVFLWRIRPLEGRVVSAADGSPVAGARVRLVSGPMGPKPSGNPPRVALLTPGLPEATTGSDGRFRMEAGRAGAGGWLEAKAPGFAQSGVSVDIPEGPGTVAAVEVRLEPAAHIVGVVRDPGGRPVAQARVLVAPAGPPVHRVTWTSVTEGVFSFPTTGGYLTSESGAYATEGFPRGGVFRVEARKEGFAPSAGGEEVYLPPGLAEVRQDLVLGPAGVLEVSWRAAGRGAAGPDFVSLEALATGESSFDPLSGNPHRFANLPPGPYRVTVLAPDGSKGAAETVVVAGLKTEVKVRLGEGIALEGIVVDAEGLPLAGEWVGAFAEEGMATTDARSPAPGLHGSGGRTAPVTARRTAEDSLGSATGWTVTDAAGRFRIAGLLPGSSWQLRAGGERRTLVVTDPVPAPAKDLRIVLPLLPVGTLEGRLLMPQGVDPSTPLRVLFLPDAGPEPGFSGYGGLRKVTGFGDGRFRLEDLPAGPGRVWATAGDACLPPVAVTIPAGGGADLGELAMAPFRRVEGCVRDPAGAPLPRVTISLDLGGTDPGWVLTAEDGSFSVPAIPGMEGVIRVFARGFLTVILPLPAADDAAPIEIVLSRGGLLRLAAYDARGVPLAACPALAAPAEEGRPPLDLGWTDARGRLRVTVPAGEYRIEILSRDGSGGVLAEAAVALEEGGEAVVEMRVAR